MVVDDNDGIRDILGRLIDAAEDIVCVARCADGREALDVLHDAAPDVVVTDLSMPGMNGVDTTRAVRERAPGVDVLVLTATPDSELAARALDAGARQIFAKNGDPTALIAAIRESA